MSRALTLPPDYAILLADLKAQVRSAQLRAHRVVNTELLGLYWRIGDAIRVRQEAAGWGAKVIDQLAADLRAEFPEMTGLRRTNVYAMRAFATAWPENAIVRQPIGRLPWGHVITLLEKLDDPTVRDWYAAATDTHGWSRNARNSHRRRRRSHAWIRPMTSGRRSRSWPTFRKTASSTTWSS